MNKVMLSALNFKNFNKLVLVIRLVKKYINCEVKFINLKEAKDII